MRPSKLKLLLFTPILGAILAGCDSNTQVYDVKCSDGFELHDAKYMQFWEHNRLHWKAYNKDGDMIGSETRDIPAGVRCVSRSVPTSWRQVNFRVEYPEGETSPWSD